MGLLSSDEAREWIDRANTAEAEVERLREALAEAVAAARLFNRGGMTWLEYDRELVRLEQAAFDETQAGDDDALCPHGFPPEFCGNCHEEDEAASRDEQAR
jgi:hypothetical protein